ncbi:hypothetical protein T484DRAFT_2023656 [Baffinella frigidus]|nr:hypothetical protein T484DRAFT_2023656 [Cryptophyta sp. CCMP2293]
MRGLLSVLLLLCLTRQAATFSPILGATRAALPHRLCASPRLGLRLARCSAGAELGDIVQRAALRRAEAAEILPALEELLATKPQLGAIGEEDIAGEFELVFSSAVANVPFLKGFFPNKEILSFDLQAKVLKLEIEILPFLPKINVIGNGLVFDPAASTLTYQVKEGQEPTVWELFYAADGVLGAKSSKTGLNVARRIP